MIDLERCPSEHLHPILPMDLGERLRWAEEMAKTHRLQRCPGCGRWIVWVPIPEEERVLA